MWAVDYKEHEMSRGRWDAVEGMAGLKQTRPNWPIAKGEPVEQGVPIIELSRSRKVWLHAFVPQKRAHKHVHQAVKLGNV